MNWGNVTVMFMLLCVVAYMIYEDNHYDGV